MKQRWTVTIGDGLLSSHLGVALNTNRFPLGQPNNDVWNQHGQSLFVMLGDGTIIAGSEGIVRHHSAFVSGTL
jgi:hypothetical protein